MIKPIAGIIKIGYETDNLAEVVDFDVRNLVDAFGDAGVWTLTIIRPTETVPYLVNAEHLMYEDGHLLWTVTDAETAYSGRGAVQLKYTVGEIVRNSQVYEINVGHSLVSDTDIPSAIQTWIDRFQEFANELNGKISAPETLGVAGQVLGLNEDLEPEWIDGANVSVSSVNGKHGHVILDAEDVGAYPMPANGIPETDLSQDVQESLEKADTAVQAETDPTVPSWAKNPTKPTYTAAEIGALPDKVFVTLAASGWSNNRQTVAVSEMTAGKSVIVSAVPADLDDYAAAGIHCELQEDGSLTFVCETVPSNDITVNALFWDAYETVPEDAVSMSWEQGFIVWTGQYAGAKNPTDHAIRSASLLSSGRYIIDPNGQNVDIAGYTAQTVAWQNWYGRLQGTQLENGNIELTVPVGIYALIITYGDWSATFTPADNQLVVYACPSVLVNAGGGSGGIQTETDPTVPSWAKSPTKPTYTAQEIGAYELPANGIPKSDLAQSVQDSLDLADTALQSFTETDPTVPTWAKSPTKPTYTAAEVGALPDSTTIPTKTSDLTNDSGFLTQHQSLADYQTKAIADAGGYFTTDTVEGALQELGALTDGIETLLAAI